MKIKKIKASALLVTLMILGIMLIVGLSVSLVSIKERTASIGESKSGTAFQNAQSGVEAVLQDILKSTPIKTTAGQLSGWDGCKVKKTGYYEVTLEDASGPIPCSGGYLLTNVVKIKSVGFGTGNQRAIEAVVR
jgi:hypothetical protein